MKSHKNVWESRNFVIPIPTRVTIWGFLATAGVVLGMLVGLFVLVQWLKG